MDFKQKLSSMALCKQWRKYFIYILVALVILFIWDAHNYHNILSFDSNKSRLVKPGQLLTGITNNTVTLVSYNLCCHYIMTCTLKAKCQERLAQFLAQSKDYDILLLQEVFVMQLGPFYYYDNAGFLIGQSAKESFHCGHSLLDSLGNVLFAQNNGLVTLSKYPVRTSKSVQFTCSGIIEYPTCKGYAMVELPVIGTIHTGRSLYVFNVHLDAHRSVIRECQLQELLTLVSRLPAQSYVVICGDLNVDSLKGDGREYQAIQSIMGSLGLQEVFGKHNVTFFDGSHLDHAFVSRNIAVQRSAVRNLKGNNLDPVSDHSGLFIKLKLLE